MFAFSLVAVFLTHTPFALAQWQPGDVARVRRQVRSSFDLNTLYFDQIRAAAIATLQQGVARVVDGPVELYRQRVGFGAGHFRGSAEAFYYPALRRRGHSALVVYLPTLFQESDDAETDVNLRALLDGGNSVLYVPNPLAPEYMRAGPVDGALQFETEAELVENLLAHFVRAHRAELTTVHLFGVSYGAFLASVILGRGALAIGGQTTLLYPPLDLAYAVYALDNMQAKRASSWYNVGPRLVGNMLDECLRAYLGATPGRSELDAITFSRAIERFSDGGMARLAGLRGRLFHWLERAHDSGVTRVRVLDADNDNLNRVDALAQAPDWARDPGHILVHRNGGHDGFYDSEFYQAFVRAAMADRGP